MGGKGPLQAQEGGHEEGPDRDTEGSENSQRVRGLCRVRSFPSISPIGASSAVLRGILILEGAWLALALCVSGRGARTLLFFIWR